MATKICKECGVEKPVDGFYKKAAVRGKQYYDTCCKECRQTQYRKRWADMSTEERQAWNKHQNNKKDYHKNYRLQTKYGLSLEQFNEMYEHQSGQCAICSADVAPNKICVDHDHNTGRVRQLLCHNCNVILGHCFENPSILIKCVDYLNANLQENNLS